MSSFQVLSLSLCLLQLQFVVFFFQDFSPLALFFYKQHVTMFSASHAMFNSSCLLTKSSACRDDTSALNLKLIAMASILVAGVTGISVPLFGRSRGGGGLFSNEGNLFVAAKAFAAGVILATGFVHMLPDGSSNLTSPCLPKFPWSKFPFSGFLSMCSALLTLVADFVGTQVYERKKGEGGNEELDSVSGSGVMPAERVNGLHIVGVYAHADHHGHSHSNEAKIRVEDDEDRHGHSHSHSRSFGEGDGGSRHAVVSQVLELGIVSHSVIIGLSLGVSNRPCTIRPLVAALSFHQFFEGFALGGCISEAGFKTLKTTLMSCFFALTTPTGIAVGIGLASFYNRDSPGALIVEGVLDSISAGILIYMSLVDLIAADFMSKKMRCNVRLQVASYVALFLGATLMSGLAIWT